MSTMIITRLNDQTCRLQKPTIFHERWQNNITSKAPFLPVVTHRHLADDSAGRQEGGHQHHDVLRLDPVPVHVAERQPSRGLVVGDARRLAVQLGPVVLHLN